MADAKVWKVYTEQGTMTASTAHAEDAAALVALHPGSYVKRGGRIVYRYTHETGDSYDAAASEMRRTYVKHQRERMGR